MIHLRCGESLRLESESSRADVVFLFAQKSFCSPRV